MSRRLNFRAPRWSVRTRVIAAVVSLAALALILAGGTAYLVERDRVKDAADASLTQGGQIFSQIATDGFNSRTGEAFTSLYDVLYHTMQVVPADPTESMVAFIDGEPVLHARPDVATRIESDDALLVNLARLSAADHAFFSTVTGDFATYRAAVYPIDFKGEHGAFILVYDEAQALKAVNTSYRTYALVGGAAMVLIGLMSWVLVGRLLQPIRLLRVTSEEISSSDLSRRIPIIGNDDLALVSETFNTMLDRLESAFAAKRALLDDVGHELRTPLTIVRGHLELMAPADVEDVAQTKEMVIDEIDRMNVLVEDLVTLAKVRQPDFVQPTLVNVALLTDEISSKARALGDRVWVLDSLAEVEWKLDPHRITQAILQLASNAVKFSEPGTTVGIGSQVIGGELHLWVRDQGKGIAREDLERVFQRFGRVDSAIEGSGLGLTIVQSIAQAHFGTVEVNSSQKMGAHGSTFTLVIPPLNDSKRKVLDEPDSDRG